MHDTCFHLKNLLPSTRKKFLKSHLVVCNFYLACLVCGWDCADSGQTSKLGLWQTSCRHPIIEPTYHLSFARLEVSCIVVGTPLHWRVIQCALCNSKLACLVCRCDCADGGQTSKLKLWLTSCRNAPTPLHAPTIFHSDLKFLAVTFLKLPIQR